VNMLEPPQCVPVGKLLDPGMGAPFATPEPRDWYAVYTFSRHEKQVVQQAESAGVDCFVPLYKSSRRWKDRRKELELALFPGYVFVRIGLSERVSVLRLPGVVQIVGFGGKPARLPEEEINGLRAGMTSHTPLHPHPYVKTGKKVRISGGPMAGLEGILLRRKSTCRVALSIDLIMRSVAVEVDEADIEPLK
jgi:transcription antitermination factor NusG